LSLILFAAKGHKLMCIFFISALIEKWMILSYLLPMLGHSNIDTYWEKLLYVPFLWTSFQVNLATFFLKFKCMHALHLIFLIVVGSLKDDRWLTINGLVQGYLDHI